MDGMTTTARSREAAQEAVMQAEDLSARVAPVPSIRLDARNAVTKTFAAIMRERHPRSTWLPISVERERAQGNAATGTGNVIYTLSGPGQVQQVGQVREA